MKSQLASRQVYPAAPFLPRFATKYLADKDANFGALMMVGLVTAVAYATLPRYARVIGEGRSVYIGLAGGATCFLGYAFATQGWMMYAVIACNVFLRRARNAIAFRSNVISSAASI